MSKSVTLKGLIFISTFYFTGVKNGSLSGIKTVVLMIVLYLEKNILSNNNDNVDVKYKEVFPIPHY